MKQSQSHSRGKGRQIVTRDAAAAREFAGGSLLVRLDGPHGDLWMECDYDPARRRGTVHMTAYVKTARGRYARQRTTLHEYAWSDRELRGALGAAGFAEVWRKPWSAWADAQEEPRPERALWCGRAAGADGAGAALRRVGFRRVR